MLAPILANLARGSLDAAIRAAAGLCRQRPGNALVETELARLLMVVGRQDEAQTILERILHRNEKNLEALKLRAFLHLQQGNRGNALEQFSQCITLRPSDSFAQINLRAVKNSIKPPNRGERKDKPPRPVIATSLPPVHFEIGQRAVRSWQERGFHVLSLNTPSEKDVLQPHFPKVEFIRSENTAKKEFDKDYQYLDMLLDALYTAGDAICGIINADIVVRGDDSVWDDILSAARNNFTYGSRVNVQKIESNLGTMLEHGFDYFFFPREFLPLIPRTRFVIGQPAWDLFMPTWSVYRKYPRVFCYSPVALHVEHPVQWNSTSNSRFMLDAAAWIFPELAAMITSDHGCDSLLKYFTIAMAQVFAQVPKATATALFCDSPSLGKPLAPVDSLYWLRSTEETLIAF